MKQKTKREICWWGFSAASAGACAATAYFVSDGWIRDSLMLTSGSLVIPAKIFRPRIVKSRYKTTSIGGTSGARDQILVLRVDGAIVGEGRDNLATTLMGVHTISGYDIQETIKYAEEEERIKGVLVQFSTPGGTINGARAIYDSMKSYASKTNNPIYAHVEGLSASGGVMAMVGAQRIFAEPGSLIGSIGVTMGTRHWYENPTAIGSTMFSGGVDANIHSYALTAGKGKDLFSEWRPPSSEETEIMGRQLDELHDNFISHVAAARGIDPIVIRDQMGAYVFANKEAQSLGLIDDTMTRQEAVNALVDAAKIVEEYDLITIKRKSDRGLISRLIGAEASRNTPSREPGGVMAIAPSLCVQTA